MFCSPLDFFVIRNLNILIMNEKQKINLNMLLVAVNRLPKPERDGQIMEVNVNDYLNFLKYKRGEISHANNEDTISFKTVKLIAVIYSCKGITDDLQWELVL